MSEFYSRVASASLKKETTENTAVIPNVYIPIVEEDIATEYQYATAMPVSANRAKNLRAIVNKIPAPNGKITVNVEPKTFGHFLNGVFGGVTSGRILPYTGLTGTFTSGETVTGGTSSATGVVTFVGTDFLLVTPTGTFTAGETLTGGTSAATATLTYYSATVYGHAAKLPATVSATYSLQINYLDAAIRFMGVKFTGIDALAQKDNIITADVKLMARGQFRHAKVTAVTASGAGSKTITVDQTYGLVATDTIKLYRPGTGFLDFSAASTKTHTIGTVSNTTSFTVTNLQTSTAVGDLIMLAPQTASYTIVNEFPWIGGSQVSTGTALTSLTARSIEDFKFTIANEYEERHAASGNDFEDQFPSAILQKSVEVSGSLTAYYQNEDFYRNLRTHTLQAIKLATQADLISTGIYYEMRVYFPSVQFDPYETNVSTDDIVNEEIPFKGFYDSTTAAIGTVVLINTITSY